MNNIINTAVIDSFYKSLSINNFFNINKINNKYYIDNNLCYELENEGISINWDKSNVKSFSNFNIDYKQIIFNKLFNEIQHSLEKQFIKYLDEHSNKLNVQFFRHNSLNSSLINLFYKNIRFSFKAEQTTQDLISLLTSLYTKTYNDDSELFIIISLEMVDFISHTIKEFEFTNKDNNKNEQLRKLGLIRIFNNLNEKEIFIDVFVCSQNIQLDHQTIYFGSKKLKELNPTLAYYCDNNSFYESITPFSGASYCLNLYHKIIGNNYNVNKIILSV